MSIASSGYLIDFTGLSDAATWTNGGWNYVTADQFAVNTGGLRPKGFNATFAYFNQVATSTIIKSKVSFSSGSTGSGDPAGPAILELSTGKGYYLRCDNTTGRIRRRDVGTGEGADVGTSFTIAAVDNVTEYELWYDTSNGGLSVYVNGTALVTNRIDTTYKTSSLVAGFWGIWGNSNARRIGKFGADISSTAINTLTNPLVAGTAFSGTCTGYTDGAATLTGSGLSIPVTISSGTFTGTVTPYGNNITYPILPVTSGTWTLTQSALTASITRDLTLAANWYAPVMHNVAIDSVFTLGKQFNDAVIPLQEGDVLFYNRVNNLTIDDTSNFTVSATTSTNLYVRRSADGKMYQYSLNLTVADIVPNAFTFTAQTDVALNSTITSSSITVAGVDAGQSIPISITGGTYSVNGGAYTASAGTVVLGDAVTVRVTSSSSNNTAASSTLTISSVTGTFTATTLSVSYSLVSVNSGTVLAESTGNTVVTTNYPTATGLTIGGVASTSFTGSANSYSFAVPAMTNGGVYPKFGTVAAVITDGTTPSNLNITFAPKATQGFVTLTAGGSGVGYIGNYVTTVAGDQVVFDLPSVYSVTANGVRADGSIFSDYSGTQTMWHRNGTTGVMTQLSVSTPVVVSAFSFTAATGSTPSATITSGSTTVAGIPSATPVPISITGGTYSVNGGAYTASAGTVVLGDVVTVRVVASASYTTLVSATLNIGGTTGVFNATTRTAITAPTSFTLTAVNGAVLSSVNTSNSITVLGIDGGTVTTAISITGGTYSVNGGAYTSTAGTVKLNDVVTVRVTASASANTGVSATLNIGGVTGIYNVSTGTPVLVPSAFTLTAATGVNASSVNTSNSISVLGITSGYSIGISITGGTYSVNGGAYTASAGTVTLNDTVTVRVTASASYSTLASATLNINGTSATYNVTTRVADTTPNAFTFATVSGVNTSTVTTSASITVLGVDAAVPVPISISGGTYSVNGGVYTSSAGNVVLNDVITVRVTSSAAYQTGASASLNIGGTVGSFAVNTRAPITTPTAFNFTAATNANPSTTVTSNQITVMGIDGGGVTTAISITGGVYCINGGAYTSSPGTVALGDTVYVQLTSSASFNTLVSATLTIGGVTGTFNATTRAVDVIPSAFSFTAASGATVSSTVTSNTITVAGVDAGQNVAISITGGTYSKNGGAYTASAGNVQLGDTVAVRVVASASSNATTSATVTIGTVPATFSVSTGAVVTTPSAFSFVAATGVTVSTVSTSNPITVSGTTPAAPVAISISSGTYSVNGGVYTSTSGTVVLGDVVTVRVTTSALNSTATSTTLTIGGVTGTYTATTAAPAIVTTPTAFSFTAASNVNPSAVTTSSAVVVAGVTAATPIAISITGGTYAVNGGAYTASAGNVVLGDSITVRVTASAAFTTGVSAALTIGGVSATFTATTRARKTAPAVPATVVAAVSYFESAVIAITDVDAGADIPYTVTGGDIAIDSGSGFGAYSTAGGNVQLGYNVKLRLTQTAAQTAAGQGTVTAVIGGVTVTYIAGGAGGGGVVSLTPAAFTFTNTTAAPLNSTINSDIVNITGVSDGVNVPITVTGGSYSYIRNSTQSNFTTVPGNVRLADRIQLQVATGTASGGTETVSVTVGTYTTTWTVANQLAVNIVPSPITFVPVTNAALGSVVTSSFAIITGVDAGTDIPITVTGAQYSIDSGAGFGPYAASPGTVRLGNKVALRITTPGTLGAVTNASVNVGTTIGAWSVTNTTSVDITPTAFTLTPVINAVAGQQYLSNAVVIAGVDAGVDVPFTVTGAEWSVDSGSGFTVWNTNAGTLRLGNGFKLRLNASTTSGLSRAAVVNFSGYDARWSVTTLATAVAVTVPKLTSSLAAANTSLTTAIVSDAGLMAAQTL